MRVFWPWWLIFIQKFRTFEPDGLSQFTYIAATGRNVCWIKLRRDMSPGYIYFLIALEFWLPCLKQKLKVTKVETLSKVMLFLSLSRNKHCRFHICQELVRRRTKVVPKVWGRIIQALVWFSFLVEPLSISLLAIDNEPDRFLLLECNATSVSLAVSICETVNLNGWAPTGERVPRNGDCVKIK